MNTSDSLQVPKISFHCPQEWEKMSGSERLRLCFACGHHVHNFATLSKAEAKTLIAKAREEHVCGTFLVRLDGSLVTAEAPLLQRDRSRAVSFSKSMMSAAALSLAVSCVAQTEKTQDLSELKPFTVPTPAPDNANKPEEEIILLTGFMVMQPPTPPPLVDRSHKPEMRLSEEKRRNLPPAPEEPKGL